MDNINSKRKYMLQAILTFFERSSTAKIMSIIITLAVVAVPIYLLKFHVDVVQANKDKIQVMEVNLEKHIQVASGDLYALKEDTKEVKYLMKLALCELGNKIFCQQGESVVLKMKKKEERKDVL